MPKELAKAPLVLHTLNVPGENVDDLEHAKVVGPRPVTCLYASREPYSLGSNLSSFPP